MSLNRRTVYQLALCTSTFKLENIQKTEASQIHEVQSFDVSADAAMYFWHTSESIIKLRKGRA